MEEARQFDSPSERSDDIDNGAVAKRQTHSARATSTKHEGGIVHTAGGGEELRTFQAGCTDRHITSGRASLRNASDEVAYEGLL